MWILPHLLVHLVVVYGAIQLIFAGVFVAQFLLSIMDPVQGRTEDMWQMLFLVHSVAYWLTALVILVLAFVWVRTCMYVHGEVGLFNPCPDHQSIPTPNPERDRVVGGRGQAVHYLAQAPGRVPAAGLTDLGEDIKKRKKGHTRHPKQMGSPSSSIISFRFRSFAFMHTS